MTLLQTNKQQNGSSSRSMFWQKRRIIIKSKTRIASPLVISEDDALPPYARGSSPSLSSSRSRSDTTAVRRPTFLSSILTSSLLILALADRALTAVSAQAIIPTENIVSSIDTQQHPMMLALVPQDNIPRYAIPISMEKLQQYLKMPSVETEGIEAPELEEQDKITVPDNSPHPKPHDKPPPDVVHHRNENATHHHGIEGIHLHDLGPVVEFIKAIIVADQPQDQDGITDTTTTDGSTYSTTTMNDQLVIVSTVLGMSLFVVFISFRKQRKWKMKQRSIDHKKNSSFFTHTYIDDETGPKDKNKNFMSNGSNIWYNVRRRLLGSASSKQQQQYSDVYYGDPSLVSGSSHSDTASIYGYNTFSADSEYYDHRQPYSPVFSHGGWNSDLEKFDV